MSAMRHPRFGISPASMASVRLRPRTVLCIVLCLAPLLLLHRAYLWTNALLTRADQYASLRQMLEDGDVERFSRDSEFAQRVLTFARAGTLSQLHSQLAGRLVFTIDGGRVGTVAVDVSHSGESGFLYRRMASKPLDASVARLVVDIGANDGFLSSNSYNWVHWGWSTVLVEPNPAMMRLARANQEQHMDPLGAPPPKPSACYVEAAMGTDKDTTMDLQISTDAVTMESSLTGQSALQQKRRRELGGSAQTISVPVLTVKSLAARCNVPLRFGILSIDAEGVGAIVLHQWIDAGFRPSYIIYEPMHNTEPLETTEQFLSNAGYMKIKSLGWNAIFELKH